MYTITYNNYIHHKPLLELYQLQFLNSIHSQLKSPFLQTSGHPGSTRTWWPEPQPLRSAREVPWPPRSAVWLFPRKFIYKRRIFHDVHPVEGINHFFHSWNICVTVIYGDHPKFPPCFFGHKKTHTTAYQNRRFPSLQKLGIVWK